MKRVQMFCVPRFRSSALAEVAERQPESAKNPGASLRHHRMRDGNAVRKWSVGRITLATAKNLPRRETERAPWISNDLSAQLRGGRNEFKASRNRGPQKVPGSICRATPNRPLCPIEQQDLSGGIHSSPDFLAWMLLCRSLSRLDCCSSQRLSQVPVGRMIQSSGNSWARTQARPNRSKKLAP